MDFGGTLEKFYELNKEKKYYLSIYDFAASKLYLGNNMFEFYPSDEDFHITESYTQLNRNEIMRLIEWLKKY